MGILSSFMTSSKDKEPELSSPWFSIVKTIGSLMMMNYSLPGVLRQKINEVLSAVPGYSASVSKVEVHPLAGRVSFHEIQVSKKITREKAYRIVSIKEIEIDLQWKSLWSKKLIASIEVTEPKVQWDAALSNPETAPRPNSERRRQPPAPWRQWINAVPFRLDRLLLKGGAARIRNTPDQGKDPLEVSDVFLVLKNLTNSEALGGSMNATVDCRAQIMQDGRLQAHVEGQPLSASPTLAGDLEIRGVDLKQWQNLFKYYMGVEIQGGVLDVAGEAVLENGIVRGYVKPIVDGLHLKAVSCSSWSLRIKATLAQWLTRFLRNDDADRIATRIRFEGSIDDPKIFVFSTLTNFVKNAFQAAFTARLEHQIFFAPFRRTWRDPEVVYSPAPTPSRMMVVFNLVKQSIVRWNKDKAPRMAAALAYYTAFSMAPLLLLVISVASLILGHDAARGRLVEQLSGLVGAESAKTIETMIAASWNPSAGVIGMVVSVVMLFVGATGVLSELKDGLNLIWNTTEPGGLGDILKARARSVGLILGIGFLMIVSLVVSAALAASTHWLNSVLPFPAFLLYALNGVISLGVLTILFAILFKYLPDKTIRWREVGLGSLVTAALFSLGKSSLGLYLGRSAVTSSYGAAGSVLVVLLWVYYSSLILYFGAEFTKASSDAYRLAEPPARK